VTGARVVVVGSGSTAMTLVPALAKTAAHVSMLQRTPTWVASLPGRDRIAERLHRRLPERAAYLLTRAVNIVLSQATYTLARRRPERFAATCPTRATSTPTSCPATNRGTSGYAASPTAT
jgi:cation diffusion facilitator CzcD-associated flavoprotein CzcO